MSKEVGAGGRLDIFLAFSIALKYMCAFEDGKVVFMIGLK